MTVPTFNVNGTLGRLVRANGTVFKVVGTAVSSGAESVAPVATILSLIPGINTIRYAILSWNVASVNDAYVVSLTNAGLWVVIENHSTPGGGVGTTPSGAALAAEAAVYAALATKYINNPLVAFGTPNEPPNTFGASGSITPGAKTAEDVAIYNAIRGTGNNAVIEIEQIGGGVPPGFSAAQTLGAGQVNGLNPASAYSTMRNIIWGPHQYNWLTQFSTSTAVNQAMTSTIKTLCQQVPTGDGLGPVAIFEFGVSTSGTTPDAGGINNVLGVEGSGIDAVSWGWSFFDVLNAQTNAGDGSGNPIALTSPWGTNVAAWAATTPPPPTFTPSSSGTRITTAQAASIVDTAGNQWNLAQSAILGLQITANGTVDTTTSNVVVLEYLNGVVVQENTSGNWYALPAGTLAPWALLPGDPNAPSPPPPPPPPPPTNATFTVTGLTAGTAYDFRVAATNAGGTGPFSTILPNVSTTGTSVVQTTFDPATSTMALSNANLTATSTGGTFQTARSTTGISSTAGLRQFEITMVAGSSDVGFGIINQLYVFGQTSGIGGDVNGVGFYPTIGGNIYCGSGTPLVNGAASSASGDVVTCVFDPLNLQIWFSNFAMRAAGLPWNWSNTANPATGAGGVQLTAFAMGTFYIAVNDNVGGAISTLNTGNTAFVVPLVTGAIPWDSGATVAPGTAPGTMSSPTIGTVTANTVALTWTAPTGTPTFTYTVQTAPASAGPWTTVASIFNALGTTVGSLAPSTLVFFRVSATNTVGSGAASTAVSTNTLAGVAGSVAGLLSPGPLSTLGNQIVDASGNPQRMSGGGWAFGYNRPNQLIGLDQCSYQQLLDTVKAVGLNCVRLHTSDRAVLNGDPLGSFNTTLNPTFVGKTYLQCLGLIMDYGLSIGIRFIVDSHSCEGNIPQQSNGLWYDVGGASTGVDGNGQTGTITDAQWIQAWQARASAFVGKAALIGYDLRNEPLGYNGMSTWGNMAGATPGSNTDIKDAYQRAGNAIHAIDPAKPLIICEGPQNYSGNYAGIAGLLCPQGDLTGVTTQPVVLTTPNKVVYSIHNYPASVSSFVPDSGAGAIAQWMGSWGFVFQNNLAPILIGEGGTTLTGAADQAWAATLVSFCNGTAAGGPTLSGTKQGISMMWWNLSSAADPNQGNQFSMLTGYIGGSLLASNGPTIRALQFKQAVGGGGPTGVAPPISVPLGSATPGTWTLKSINGMFYWELLPQGYSTTASYPLLLCLHQLDQGNAFYSNGNNGAADIVKPQWDPWVNNAAFRQAHPAIVLLPLLNGLADTSGNTLNWGGITTAQQPSQTNYIALVQSYMQTFSVNPNKVYITGNSMGGDGAWDTIIKYNTKAPLVRPIFASALILAGVTFAYNYPTPTPTMVSNMRTVPLFVIHGGNNDTNSPIAWDDAMAAVIGTQVGGNMHYTRDSNLGHDVWDTYYTEPLSETYWSQLFAQNF